MTERNLTERLRHTAGELRMRPLSLSDFIPLLQEAADELDRVHHELFRAHGLLQQGLVISRLGRMLDEAEPLTDKLRKAASDTPQLMVDAASEIERLRSQVAQQGNRDD